MRFALRLLMTVVLVMTLGASVAAAQEDPYVGERPPEVGGEEFERPVSEPKGPQADRPAVSGAVEGRGTEVRGVQVSRGLALTGSDIVGLTAIGLGLIAFGAVLVRRRRRPVTA